MGTKMFNVDQHVSMDNWLGLSVAYAVVRHIDSASGDYVVEIFAAGDRSVWTGAIPIKMLHIAHGRSISQLTAA